MGIFQNNKKFTRKNVQNTNTPKKTWKTPSGDTFQTPYPPLQEIIVSQGNTEILASSLKKISFERSDESEVVTKHVKNIQVESNCTNIVLQSMCSQLNKIEVNSNSEAFTSKIIEKKKPINSLFKSHKTDTVPLLGNLNIKANVLKEFAIQLSKLSISSNKINTIMNLNPNLLMMKFLISKNKENKRINIQKFLLMMKS